MNITPYNVKPENALVLLTNPVRENSGSRIKIKITTLENWNLENGALGKKFTSQDRVCFSDHF